MQTNLLDTITLLQLTPTPGLSFGQGRVQKVKSLKETVTLEERCLNIECAGGHKFRVLYNRVSLAGTTLTLFYEPRKLILANLVTAFIIAIAKC